MLSRLQSAISSPISFLALPAQHMRGCTEACRCCLGDSRLILLWPFVMKGAIKPSLPRAQLTSTEVSSIFLYRTMAIVPSPSRAFIKSSRYPYRSIDISLMLIKEFVNKTASQNSSQNLSHGRSQLAFGVMSQLWSLKKLYIFARQFAIPLAKVII